MPHHFLSAWPLLPSQLYDHGLMTFMSNAAGRERDQFGTRMSAGLDWSLGRMHDDCGYGVDSILAAQIVADNNVGLEQLAAIDRCIIQCTISFVIMHTHLCTTQPQLAQTLTSWLLLDTD